MKTENYSKLYDKNYKYLLLFSISILIISLMYLFSFSQVHGDIIRKDISLTGGTSIQINSNQDINQIREHLSQNSFEFSIRQVSDLITGEQLGFIIETSSTPEEIIPTIEEFLGFELNENNSSVEFTGASLSESFYNQLRIAIAISFIFMAIVVFIIFRSFIPSIAVILAAFTDIVFTISVANLLGMEFSTAGIVALLMLIGYSVDTDILLTTRVLKRHDSPVNERIFGAFKTGLTMSLTSLAVVLVGLFLTASFSKVFSQIFTILSIGLIADIFITWLGNASIIKWYAEKSKW